MCDDFRFPFVSHRPPQCVLAVHRSLAQRRMHDMGDGRVVVPLLEPTADELPFAVALELHRRGVPGHCSDCTASGIGGMDSFQLHYVLQGSAEVCLACSQRRMHKPRHALRHAQCSL